MEKIDWKRKLSSRKFWAALVGYLTTILTAFSVDAGSIEKIGVIVTGIGLLAVYILAEGKIDKIVAENAPAQNIDQEVERIVGTSSPDGGYTHETIYITSEKPVEGPKSGD